LTDHTKKVRNPGLHFCKNYKNLVKYNPELCGHCPYNGLKK
jgi:hypothetical protein